MKEWLFLKWLRFLDKLGLTDPWGQMAITWIVCAFLIISIPVTVILLLIF